MTEQQWAQQLRDQILQTVEQLDIPWYFTKEVEKILEPLNYYKLQNLLEHIDEFKEFLIELDQVNTAKIKDLVLSYEENE